MKYGIVLTLLLLCLSAPETHARGAWDNPLHEPRTKKFLAQIPEENNSQVFIDVRNELDGCLYDYMQSRLENGPKTPESLNAFIIQALKTCQKEIIRLEHVHDQVFGEGTGEKYFYMYALGIREFVRDFFKIPYVESR